MLDTVKIELSDSGTNIMGPRFSFKMLMTDFNMELNIKHVN